MCRRTYKQHQNLLFEAKKKDERLSYKVRSLPIVTRISESFFENTLFSELEPSARHLSKSHERRVKRKAKEQLTGNMDDLQIALASLHEDSSPPESIEKHVPGEVKPKASSSIGKIGKGPSSTLSKAQRKRLL